jgi:tetratricopeptide (TPR) repeat protein
MGAALTIAVLLPGLALGSAPNQDPALEALRSEHVAIKKLLDEPCTHAQGRLALQAFVTRLRDDPRTSASLLYNRAKELADCALTPDPRARADWFDVAARASARAGKTDAALWTQEQRAHVLASIGALDEASLVIESALQAWPAVTRHRIHALVALADLLRRAGRFDAALARAREAEALADGDPSARLERDTAVLVRSAIARDVGSPERCEPELEDLARDVGRRFESGEVDASHLTNVRIELLRVAIAQGDHARVRRDAEALLADPALCRTSAEVSQALLHLGASTLELERSRRESGQRTEREARAIFEDALELDPEPADAFFLRTRLAAEALDGGDLGRCRVELEALRAIASDALPLTMRVEGPVLAAQLALAARAGRDELLARHAELARTWEDLARAWRSAPRDAQGVAFLKYSHRRAVLSQLAQLELALEPGEAGVTRAFEHLLAAQELSSLARSQAGEPVTLDALRRDVLRGQRHGLLAYLPARDGSHVFAVDRERITHHALGRSSRLEEARKAYVGWLLLDGVRQTRGADRAELLREERTRAAALAELLLPEELRARVRDWDRW